MNVVSVVMWKTAFDSVCTAALAAAGCWIGFTVHGTATAAVVPTLAGAAGGFGIGWAGLDVLRRWRSHGTRRIAGA